MFDKSAALLSLLRQMEDELKGIFNTAKEKEAGDEERAKGGASRF